ncbi:DFP-like protein [Mya arenaria]|uniref:DFP-like protein n=1 Tax=Mya arenaria TaxID=6604 RepID=A0ABY7EUT8_MYAAR|nr:DFP-like protein [Mya arenaria]
MEIQTIRNKPPDFGRSQWNPSNINSDITNSASNSPNADDIDNNQRPIRFRCRDLLPLFALRRNILPQTGSSPFEIAVYPPAVSPGDTVYVRVRASAGHVIRGFFLQGVPSRQTAGSYITTGRFVPSLQVNLQSCGSADDSASSSQGARQTEVVLQWTVPQELGDVHFRGTVVGARRQYWMDVRSADVTVVAAGLDAVINHPETELPGATPGAAQGPNSGSISSGHIKPAENGVKTSAIDDGNNIQDSDKSGSRIIDTTLVPNSDNSVNPEGLSQSVSETFESVNGPMESVKEVLLHQGIRGVAKIATGEIIEPESSVLVDQPEEEDELTIDIPNTGSKLEHRYIYNPMNKHPEDFEPPQTSEFIGSLVKGMMSSGGGGGGGGGMGSMLNMLGTMNKMKGMFGGGGGGAPSQAPGGLGMLGPLLGGMGRGAPSQAPGALGMLGPLLGGGGGGARPTGGAPGGGLMSGLLGSMLGGGNKANTGNTGGGGGGIGNLLGGLAPKPSGQPVKPRTEEPSLADLLGVDPSTVVESAPAAQPIGNSVQGTTGGGSKFGKIIKFAPMAMGAFGLMSKLGGGKKNQGMPPGFQQQGMQGRPPFGQQGQQGGFGGMGANGQQQFGMPPGGQQNGMFGQQPQQGMGGFGMAPTQSTAGFGGLGGGLGGQGAQGNSNQQILQQLQQAQAQIAQLTAKMNSGNAGGGFGSTGSSLFGTGSMGTSSLTMPTNTLFGQTKLQTDPKNDMLLNELIKQNQLLMQQNQQFMNTMATSQLQPQTNPMSVSGGGFSGLNPSATHQSPNTVQPSNNFGGGSFLNNQSPANNMPTFSGGMQQTQPAFTGSSSNLGNMFGIGGAGSSPSGQGAASTGSTMGGMSNMFGSGGAGGMGTGGGNTMSGMFGGGSGGNTGGGGGGGGLAGLMGGGGGGGGGLAGLMGGGGGGNGGGGGLAGLMGGGGGGNGGGGGLAGLLGGGGGGGGSPLAGLLGGGGGGGGGGNPLAGLLGGGGGGGGMDMASLLGNVDTNALSGMLEGEEGKSLMNSINGMMSGPQGGNLMKAMEGMMSGNMDPSELTNVMSGMNPMELMSMANQAQGLLSKTGVDPTQLLGSLMG